MCAGAIAGAVTGILTTVFEIPAILAGILTQISLWSINLRIMGKSNTPILAKGTIFSSVSHMTGLPQSTVAIILGIVLAVAIVAILYWFFGTEIGSALRATGNNEYMIRALGVNTNSTKMIALVLSNALIGLSGALICQSQKYADIGMGTGAIVIGLAAIVIGEVLGRLLPGGLTQFSRPSCLCSLWLRGVLPHSRYRAAAGHGCQRHEAALRRDRCRGPVRARGLGALQAPQLLHEGR